MPKEKGLSGKTVFLLIGAVIASIVIVYFFRNFLFYEGIETDLSGWGVFFTAFGVLYAIIAGFLMIEVLGKYSSLSDTIEQEVNSLEDIRDFLMYLDDNEKQVKEVKNSLKGYIDSVTGKEWEVMSAEGEQMGSDTSPELYKLIDSVHNINVTNESDRMALKFLMEKIGEVTSLRTKRINITNDDLPPRLKVLVIFMSLISVAGFSLMYTANFWVHILMVGSITVSVYLIYMVIMDLSHPFVGTWSIDNKIYMKLRKTL